MCLFQSEVGIVLHRLNCGLPYLPYLQRMSTFVSLICLQFLRQEDAKKFD